MIRITSLGLVLTTLAIAASAQGNSLAAFKYINGRWFNGKEFVPRTYYSVLGKLHPNMPAFRVAQTFDLEGGYVIPACGEAHNHNAVKSNRGALAEYAFDGILYVENPSNLLGERTSGDMLNGPKGPDVSFSNGGITAPGGHPIALVKRNIERGVMTAAQGEGDFYYTVSSLKQLDEKFPALLATKPDFIKVFLVYSEEFEKRKNDEKYFGRRGLDPSLIEPIVKRAHASGLRVMAHVETAHDFSVAVRAGVDQVGHMPGFWPDEEVLRGGPIAKYLIEEADARLAARKKIVVITTLGEMLGRMDSLADRRIAGQIVGVARDNLEILRSHRVRIAIGSDQYRKNSMDEAFQLMKDGLFDTKSMLNAWCLITPQIIFPRRRIGHLKDGYEANFSVLQNDPLTSPEALVAKPKMVFKAGKLISKQIPAAKK
jgi:hypothetical protein